MASAGDGGESLSLNLYPMLDIFSILITFLLMSYSTDPVTHDLSEGVELPASLTTTSIDEIPAIVVTKGEILVNEKVITTIQAGDVIADDVTQGAIYPLYEELKGLAETNKTLTQQENTSTLTMEMDKSHVFKLMKRIMLTASQAEFITFKLLVSKEST